MDASDIYFLEHLLDSFIVASLNRLSHSGDMQFTYRLTVAELKEGTNRIRLHQSVIDEYLAFFLNRNIVAEYDNSFAAFNLVLDLNRVVLNSRRAHDLAVAMESYRAEHL